MDQENFNEIAKNIHVVNGNYNRNPGRSSLESTSEILEVRYGPGYNLHIGFAIPYVSHSVANTDYTRPPVHYSNTTGKGIQNPSIWATYGVIHDKASPLSISAELLITPDTTANVKTSYTGRLIGGWKNSDTLRLYASLSATTFDDSSLANNYAFRTGAFVALSESLTLIPHAAFVRYEGGKTMSSTDQTVVGLSANVRLTPNSYLIPDVVFYRDGASNSNDGLFHREATNNGKEFNLGLYHLF